jgi:hypothetical protein
MEDIRMNISKLADYKASYHYLTVKLNAVAGSESIDYKNDLGYVIDYISSGNMKIDALTKDAYIVEFDRIQKEKIEINEKKEEERLNRDQEEIICKRMIEKIVIIEEYLYNVKWILESTLDDRELLGREKDLKSLESTFSALSEKVTTLCKQLPTDYKNKIGIVKDRSKKAY